MNAPVDFRDVLSDVPAPGPRRLALHVTPAAERHLRDGHPWLFAGSIRQQSHDGRAGDLAVVFDRKDRFLAVGLYDPEAPIRVRVLQHTTPAPINRAWFRARLTDALQRRAPLHADATTTGYRLVHGENDGLPALVVDRYGGTAVLKLYTAAWIPHLRDVLPALMNAAAAHGVDLARLVLRLSRHTAARPEELHGLRGGMVLHGPPLAGPAPFLENGLRFTADVVAGQKTGFFLDQRENRARVERLAMGKTVLNVFAYTGGFSLYAARGGAPQVVSLDLSEPALAAAETHFALNRALPAVAACDHETVAGDAFGVLAAWGDGRRRFDLVILDPPAFAKRQDEVARALGAYGRLVQLGLGVLRPGGLLVACSCSSRVAAADFFAAVHEAARGVERPLHELGRSGHPLDHPIGFAEGAYLKCLFARAG